VTSGENDEEAAWLDLIAHYDAPAEAGRESWPERENLAEPDGASIPGAPQATRAPKVPESPGTGSPETSQAKARPAPVDPPFGADLTAPDLTAPDLNGPARNGRDLAGPDPDGPDLAGPDLVGPGLTGPGLTGPGLTGPRVASGGQTPGPPPAPPPEMQEEHYFPPPPPPLPKLDPVTKGAWAALFGGPAYLLIATAVGWTVPAVAAFFAIGAFVGGFAILVMRMGDEPRDGDGPDDGAVV
jgi:hypothetical protein